MVRLFLIGLLKFKLKKLLARSSHRQQWLALVSLRSLWQMIL
jgi:hypothetical protein